MNCFVTNLLCGAAGKEKWDQHSQGTLKMRRKVWEHLKDAKHKQVRAEKSNEAEQQPPENVQTALKL